MISVCCCCLNAKWDVDIFVRHLELHNNPSEFEIVITHDDRVNDGSGEQLKKLSQEFPNVKIVTHDNDDTIRYMSRALDHYDRLNLFRPELRKAFRERLELYAQGKLIDPTKDILWQSSGILYNKAVEASKGDVIIVTPGDFIYLFKLSDIYQMIQQRQRDGLFYGSPPAVWARVNNMDQDWMFQHIQDVRSGKQARSGWQWDSVETFRDYLRYPCEVKDLTIPDFKHDKLINLADPDSFVFLERFCNAAATEPGVAQYNPAFHGFHVMTRKTFDVIGGFTEEWVHRAFPDDKMTAWGNRTGGRSLLPKFSVAWCGQGELLPYHGPGYTPGWQEKLKEIDPWFDKHPIPPAVTRVYLHSGVVEDGYMAGLVNMAFSTSAPPVRIRD